MKDNVVYSKMFMWLFIGLLVTFLTGYALSLNEVLFYNIISVGVLPLFLIEIGIAIAMGFFIKKLSPLATKILYLGFSAVTGITFGSIFIAYKLISILAIFLVTSVIFGVLAIYGYTTKKDVSKFGVLLFGLLIGEIILSVVNIFLRSNSLGFFLSMICLLVFMGYVIYDINLVKRLMGRMEDDKVAVFGAFQLYLDFINIFVELLKFFGKGKD